VQGCVAVDQGDGADRTRMASKGFDDVLDARTATRASAEICCTKRVSDVCGLSSQGRRRVVPHARSNQRNCVVPSPDAERTTNELPLEGNRNIHVQRA
jgi:hypothetical protein